MGNAAGTKHAVTVCALSCGVRVSRLRCSNPQIPETATSLEGIHAIKAAMAEQNTQPSAISAPFPAPPPFYHHFTRENLAQVRKIRKQTASYEITSNAPQSKEIDVLCVPPELRYLIPPPPPSPTTAYRTFNSHINPSAPNASLADAGIDQLYPLTSDLLENPQPQLLALARSLLTTFLALVGTLAGNPTLYEEKINDILTIMFNLHDMVNRYRPHQARESLILGMEERVERIRAEIARVKEGKEKVRELIEGQGEDGETMEDVKQSMSAHQAASGAETEVESQRKLWSDMDVALDVGFS